MGNPLPSPLPPFALLDPKTAELAAATPPTTENEAPSEVGGCGLPSRIAPGQPRDFPGTVIHYTLHKRYIKQHPSIRVLFDKQIFVRRNPLPALPTAKRLQDNTSGTVSWGIHMFHGRIGGHYKRKLRFQAKNRRAALFVTHPPCLAN